MPNMRLPLAAFKRGISRHSCSCGESLWRSRRVLRRVNRFASRHHLLR